MSGPNIAIPGSFATGKPHSLDDAGQKLKRIRERLNLRVRDVEQATLKIADKYRNDDFAVLINRLSEIENRGLAPSMYKLYSLCAVYRLDFKEVVGWYGVPLGSLAADSALVSVPETHLLSVSVDEQAEVPVPLSLDPGLDLRHTNYLSRMIQRWGKLPLLFLETLNLPAHRYGFIGTEDWFMYPLLQPGSFVMVDETVRKIANSGWTNEFERPIYFFEHRRGFVCGWCNVKEDTLVLQPHPASTCGPEIYKYPADIDLVGQVTGTAMRLDQARRPHIHSAVAP